MRFERPVSLSDALALRAQGGWQVVAGGTDVYPAEVGRPRTADMLDITAIESLRGITRSGGTVRIGALTTWTDIVHAPMPAQFDALKLAAREVGSVQIQNAGTIAGNLCNASPAADGVPPLLILDAEVELSSCDAVRRVPLRQFILGSRNTLMRNDELMTAVVIPAAEAPGSSHFLKLGTRRYLVISIVMVAAALRVDSERRIDDIRVAVGSCSAVAQRLHGLEKRLLGTRLDPSATIPFIESDLTPLDPIDDIRAGRNYRMAATGELVQRTLAACGEAAGL